MQKSFAGIHLHTPHHWNYLLLPLLKQDCLIFHPSRCSFVPWHPPLSSGSCHGPVHFQQNDTQGRKLSRCPGSTLTFIYLQLKEYLKCCCGTTSIPFEGFATKPLQVTAGFLRSHQCLKRSSHITSWPCWHRRCWGFCTPSYGREGTSATPQPLVPSSRAGSLGNPCHLPVGLSQLILPFSLPRDTVYQGNWYLTLRAVKVCCCKGHAKWCTHVLYNRLFLPVTFLLYPNCQITDDNDKTLCKMKKSADVVKAPVHNRTLDNETMKRERLGHPIRLHHTQCIITPDISSNLFNTSTDSMLATLLGINFSYY